MTEKAVYKLLLKPNWGFNLIKTACVLQAVNF